MSFNTITKVAGCALLALSLGLVAGCKEETANEKKVENKVEQAQQKLENKADEVKKQTEDAAEETKAAGEEKAAELEKKAEQLPEAAH